MEKIKVFFVILGIAVVVCFLAYAMLYGHVLSEHGGSFESWWKEWKIGMTAILGFIALIFIFGILRQLFSTKK